MVAMLSDRNGGARELAGPVDGAEAELRKAAGSLEWLERMFATGALGALRTAPFERIDRMVSDHLSEMPSIREWIDVSALDRACRESGLGEIIDLGRKSMLPPADLVGAYERRVFRSWLDQAYYEDLRLREFHGDEHARTVALFRRLDEKQMDIAQRRLRNLLNARREQALKPQSSGAGELGILRHEAAKKKRFKQIRQLFQECPHIIQALKPCLLMSPLSVSTFLDPTKVGFDLVIFDEASQVRPEDAIGSIMRARQVIVVGDGKQLPPTDFFREVNDEDEDVPDLESILDECSSSMPQQMLLWHYRSRHESLIAFSNRHIYDGKLYTFPSPGRKEGEWGVTYVRVPDGVYDRAGRRTNEAEARKVAELVLEHFATSPERSLGVVAFSEAQQLAIIEELEKLTASRPELVPLLSDEGEEGFFVKNLENVQGDERDVMIFSVGYGRDQQGKMYQNFGPLNKAGGERRLNVAITRARMHVKLVSSILPEDIESTTPGAEALREYVTYAMNHEAADNRSAGEGARDYLQAEIRSWLESRGLIVEERVGRSIARIDLAIADRNRPGNYVMGILTDGASYAMAGDARDRERLREEVLTGLGWYLHRVWSQEWIRDRDREGERILAALDRARIVAAERAQKEQESRPPEVLVATFNDVPAMPSGPAIVTGGSSVEEGRIAVASTVGDDIVAVEHPPAAIAVGATLSPMMPSGDPTEALSMTPRAVDVPESTPAVEAEATAIVEDRSTPEKATTPNLPERTSSGKRGGTMAEEVPCSPYRTTDLVSIPSLVESYRSDPSRTLIEAAEIVVSSEGPVHQSVVKERIRDLIAASTGKRPGNLDKVIKQTTAALERYGKVRVDGEFLWPAEKIDLTPRRCEGFRRNADHVCDAEMETMVLSLVPSDRPVNLKDLVSGVSVLLGYKRPTPAIRSRVERAVEVLSSRDTVVSEDEVQEARCEPPKEDEEPTAEQACP
jgi:hypothetical protein